MTTLSPSKPFMPSIYQSAIFDFQAGGAGDSVVTARAGSGKTTTAVEAAKRLSPGAQQKALFVAFNKHIADELGARLPSQIQAMTIHSLALRSLRDYYRPADARNWTDTYKYHKLARNYWRARSVDLRKYPDVEDATVDLTRFSMLTLTPATEQNLIALARHFGVTVTNVSFPALTEAVITILRQGLEMAPNCISFDDMVYLPNRPDVDCPIPHYEFLYVDESQDLNAAQREFVLQVKGDTGRAIFIGDPKQAIYGFAGADSRSFATISARTSAHQLGLPVCYRCPSSHLDMARQIVPDIQAREGAPPGIVEYVSRNEAISSGNGHRVKEGDLVLCRMTAPLIDMCFELIDNGTPARVRGRDIGQGLIKIVEAVSRMDGFTFASLLTALWENRSKTVEALSQKEDNDLAIESFCDRCESIETIYLRAVGEGVRDTESFKSYILALFDEQRGTVMLSTVHKAKGLENERVFLLKPELMPLSKANQPHEIEQEMNLRYVALTRSKSELYMIEG